MTATIPKGFHPEPFSYHQELELDIDALSNAGDGIGRVDGWVVFVPFALPGDRVKARVWRNDRNYSSADLVEVINPSPDRVEPGCRLFGTCGGCQYQHFSYDRQLLWKTRQVTDLLRLQAGLELPVNPAVASPRQYHYRSKITPHFDKPKEGGKPAIGFLKAGSRRDVVDVPQCPIAMECINEALPLARKSVYQAAARFKRGATILLRASEGTVITNNNAVACERVGDLEFHFLAGDFFQNNPFILPLFTDYVAQQASMDGEEFLAADAGAIFARVDFPAEKTAVVIDPPRKGCSMEFLTQLFAFGPGKVVYVSCNPATQIRDLAEFDKAGYSATAVQPFDLFPQTKHLECVVTLKKNT